MDEHRDPLDDLREHYDREKAQPLTKLHALTIVAGEHQTHDYYMHYGPWFADPLLASFTQKLPRSKSSM